MRLPLRPLDEGHSYSARSGLRLYKQSSYRFKGLYLFYILLVFAICTPFSPDILQLSGNYVPEIAFAPLALAAYYLRNQAGAFVFRRHTKTRIIILVLILAFTVVGLLSNGTLKNIYTDLRAWLTFYLMFCFMTDMFFLDQFDLRYIILPLWTYSVTAAIYSYTLGEGIKAGVLILPSLFLMLFYAKRQNLGLLLLTSGISAVIVVFSLFRSNWIAFALALSFSLVIYIFRSSNKNRTLINLGTIVVLIIVSTSLLTKIDVLGFYNSNESSQIQIINKTNEFVGLLAGNGYGNESDNLRIEYFSSILNDFDQMLLPHGLGFPTFLGNLTKDLNRFDIQANIIDNIYLYLIWTVGLLPIFGLIILIVYQIRKFVIYDKLFFYSGTITVFVFGLFNGSMIVDVGKAFVSAACLALLWTHSIKTVTEKVSS